MVWSNPSRDSRYRMRRHADERTRTRWRDSVRNDASDADVIRPKFEELSTVERDRCAWRQQGFKREVCSRIA